MQDRRESDEALVLKAQTGDGAAENEILLRYKSAVRARARQFFLAGGETEDLVQEGMIGLYSAIKSYKAESGKRFKNFAYLCVTRRIYDVLSKAGKVVSVDADSDPDMLPEGESPEDLLLGVEERAELTRILAKALSVFEYRVFTMYLDGLSYAEIAETLGENTKSVDNALARAKKKLIKAFQK